MNAKGKSVCQLLEDLVHECIAEGVFVETEEGLLLLIEDRERAVQGIKTVTKRVAGIDVGSADVLKVLRKLENAANRPLPM